MGPTKEKYEPGCTDRGREDQQWPRIGSHRDAGGTTQLLIPENKPARRAFRAELEITGAAQVSITLGLSSPSIPFGCLSRWRWGCVSAGCALGLLAAGCWLGDVSVTRLGHMRNICNSDVVSAPGTLPQLSARPCFAHSAFGTASDNA